VELNSKTFRMADRLTNGRLVEIVAGERQRGQSYDAIVRRLYADYGIEVTRQTLSDWASGLGIDKGSDSTSAAGAA
jgi:hypothetical protein